MNKASTDRKTQIIEAASALFGSQGFDGVTVRQLAQACDITEAALYRYFKSKDEMYDAVLDSIEARLQYERLFDRLKIEEDLETLLLKFAHHVLDFFGGQADLCRLLLFSALQGHAKAKQVYEKIRGTYTKFLKLQFDRFYRSGLIVKKNNEITARCFVGMVFDCSLATTLWKGLQGPVFQPEKVVANNVPIYVRGLKA